MLKKIKENKLFNDLFGFEKGIDISNETEVLHRRNIVIKNIIFVSNIVYTILMMGTSLINMNSNSSTSNWILTIVLFPLTFGINYTLKRIMNSHTTEKVYQQIAMYVACIYIFALSFLIYFKLKMNDASFGEAGYILLYYSIVVISLYQDKNAMKNASFWLVTLFIMTHLLLTAGLTKMEFTSTNAIGQITEFLTSNAFYDIVFRTIILIMFIVVVYVIVSISQYMQDERKKELLKRKEVEDDFIKVVTDMFDVTLNNKDISETEHEHVDIVSKICQEYSIICGFDTRKQNDVISFVSVHLDNTINLDLTDITDKEEQFEILRNQTSLGNRIVKRLDLERKCKDLIRAISEGFTEYDKSKILSLTDIEQVILISDIYVTLRDVTSYKKPINHKRTMELMTSELRMCFDAFLFEKFVRFQDKFELIFDNY